MDTMLSGNNTALRIAWKNVLKRAGRLGGLFYRA